MRYLVVYEGDECLGVFESREAAAKALRLSKSTIEFYLSPSYLRRCGESVPSDQRKYIIEVDVDGCDDE